jgi:cardiolipin synthase
VSSFELLVGPGPFWDRAAADIAAAKQRVLVQAMTFEGDSAGSAVAAAVEGSGARDRRILVDDYIRHVINDRFLALPQARWNKPLLTEAQATRTMFGALARAGVGVRVTNPINGNPARYAIRNHKKLIVADDVAYLGGVNFSDHNFGWDDLMVRIEGAAAVDFLASDFDGTWSSKGRAALMKAGNLSLYALDGRSNTTSFADLFAAIEAARERIEVVSAYPTFPFIQALGAAAKRGVQVEIFTALPSNKPIVRAYVAERCSPLGITLHFLPKMTHLKGMLIDGRTLALGSTNFDFASFNALEEYLAMIDDPTLAEAFRREVLAPARAVALPEGDYRSRRWHIAWSLLILWLGDFFTRLMRPVGREAVDWR